MDNQVNNQVKTKRDMFKERLAAKYPDRDFEDDEVLFGAINDDYDDSDKKIGEYKEREGKFADMFSADPRSAQFLTNWSQGADPAVELVRQFGTEIKDAIDDPAKLEEISKANKEFVDKVAKEKELNDQYQKNLAESLKSVEEYQQRNGLTDQQVDDAMEFLVNIVKDGVMGKFTPESIDMAMKAINHDTDVASANLEGEVRGKNTKVEEKLRKQNSGDGIPNMSGANGGPGTNTKKRGMNIFDFADAAK